nr:MAG TPA: hypothetical protein [Inoviridae sp.]
MKRFFALLLACWVLCLSVCADEVILDPAPAPDPAPVEDPASAPDPAPAPDLSSDLVPAPAPDPVPDEVNNDSTVQTPAPVSPPVDSVVDVPPPTFTLDEVLAALPESVGSPDVVSEDVVLTGISRVSVPPVTPSSTTGLKAALLTVLGNYDPVVVVYQYNTSSSGYSSYATDIQPDYVWIASAVLLSLVIWCLFKLGGALFRG